MPPTLYHSLCLNLCSQESLAALMRKMGKSPQSQQGEPGQTLTFLYSLVDCCKSKSYYNWSD